MKPKARLKQIENDVVIFTDQEDVKQLAQRIIRELKLNLIHAEDTLDLYAIGFFFGIIDPVKLDEDYLENFACIHEAENPKEFSVYFTQNAQGSVSSNFFLR